MMRPLASLRGMTLWSRLARGPRRANPRGRRLALVLAAGLAAASAPWPAPAPLTAAAPGTTVAVTTREFAFEPAVLTVPAGAITFEVRNEGVIEHNFVVEDAQRTALASIAVIAPGATESVTATLAPGTYTVVCTLPGHREAGMVGTLTVK